MLRKTMQIALTLGLITGVQAATMQSAEAGRGGGVAAGVAVGTLLGLGIAGAYAGPRCYVGPRQCDWVGRHCWTNRFGEYVCRGGNYRCWHPRICD